MADDPVEAARKREAAMLRRGSYFPAANLRQYEGTELSPPGAGTYYHASRYAGAPANLQRRAQRALAGQYQSDLAFNVMANPRMAQSLEAERIGAQYGGGKSFAGKPGYKTVYLPSGGTTVVTDSVANRLLSKQGYSLADKPKRGYPASGKPAQPGMTIYHPPESYGFFEPQRWSTFNQAISRPLGQAFSEMFSIPRAAISGLGTLGQRAYEALSRGMSGPAQYGREQFGEPSPLAGGQSDLRNEIDGTFYGGGHAYPTPTPTPTPNPTSRLASAPIGYQTDFMGAPAALQESFGQPRRYFDL